MPPLAPLNETLQYTHMHNVNMCNSTGHFKPHPILHVHAILNVERKIERTWSMDRLLFTVKTMIRGYHIYRDTQNPISDFRLQNFRGLLLKETIKAALPSFTLVEWFDCYFLTHAWRINFLKFLFSHMWHAFKYAKICTIRNSQYMVCVGTRIWGIEVEPVLSAPSCGYSVE